MDFCLMNFTAGMAIRDSQQRKWQAKLNLNLTYILVVALHLLCARYKPSYTGTPLISRIQTVNYLLIIAQISKNYAKVKHRLMLKRHYIAYVRTSAILLNSSNGFVGFSTAFT
jgi:hypothetical protein